MMGTAAFDGLVEGNPAVWSPPYRLSRSLETSLAEVFRPDYAARLQQARGGSWTRLVRWDGQPAKRDSSGGPGSWLTPPSLAFAADAGAFAALGGQDVGVAGVGVTPAQVGLQFPGEHGVAEFDLVPRRPRPVLALSWADRLSRMT